LSRNVGQGSKVRSVSTTFLLQVLYIIGMHAKAWLAFSPSSSHVVVCAIDKLDWAASVTGQLFGSLVFARLRDRGGIFRSY